MAGSRKRTYASVSAWQGWSIIIGPLLDSVDFVADGNSTEPFGRGFSDFTNPSDFFERLPNIARGRQAQNVATKAVAVFGVLENRNFSGILLPQKSALAPVAQLWVQIRGAELC